MKKILKKEVVIGICAIIASIILFSGIEFLKGINVFKPENKYYISYTNVAGLDIASPVTINGFKIGQVLDIEYEYDNPGHVLVEISLNKDLKLPIGTKAILSPDLLGAASIALEMGQSDDFYSYDDRIEGITPSRLMDNINKDIMPSIIEIVPKVDTLLTSVNRIIGDPAISSSVRRLDEITSNLSSIATELNSIMKSLPSVVSNVDGFASNLNKISEDLAIVSDDLKSLPIDSTLCSVNNTSKNLEAITNNINKSISSNETTLGLLIKDNSLYNNLNGAAANLDSLLIDIKNNPKRYISIKLF